MVLKVNDFTVLCSYCNRRFYLKREDGGKWYWRYSQPASDTAQSVTLVLQFVVTYIWVGYEPLNQCDY